MFVASSPPVMSDGYNLMGLSVALDLLKEFRPRSRAAKDKEIILHNLCLVYSKDAKQLERAVLILSDMVARNVSLGLCNTSLCLLILAECSFMFYVLMSGILFISVLPQLEKEAFGGILQHFSSDIYRIAV